ncbi:2,3-butanediol dehydrogenase [Fictibacillus terranigra]|uniref:2,3-butanediol dehydrogenase n=1 Tax=Fictibacillus terranigra TaxID=3058424 RepID=A0ABT8EBU8_9BACL|nr:2,3-butanediol dehydrogenase [Fictibacillus sp. CENA-BCM004]MDN4075370.1 2,3-butanediol dehydrogenase [Fictibacillus sp. CENA-BCM004]
MKGVLWYQAKDVRVEEIPEPQVKEGTVKIKVKWAGICGSDLHEYLVGPIFIPVEEPHPLTKDKAPIVLGHEFSGEVTEIGEGVTQVAVGDRVAVEPIYACGECVACRAGHYNVCEQLGFHGLAGGGGGFAEYTVVNENMVHKLPDNMSYEQGALVEPAAVALHAVRQSKFKPGDTAAVFGTGPIGLLTIQALKAAGASKVFVVDLSEERRNLARKIGADVILNPAEVDAVQEIKRLTNDLGVEVSFDAAGVEPTLNGAIQSTRFDGQVVIISIWEATASIPPNELVLKERDMIGVLAYRNIFPSVIKLISQGQMKAEDLITKKIMIDDIVQEGFEALVNDKSHVKILVKPRED